MGKFPHLRLKIRFVKKFLTLSHDKVKLYVLRLRSDNLTLIIYRSSIIKSFKKALPIIN